MIMDVSDNVDLDFSEFVTLLMQSKRYGNQSNLFHVIKGNLVNRLSVCQERGAKRGGNNETL